MLELRPSIDIEGHRPDDRAAITLVEFDDCRHQLVVAVLADTGFFVRCEVGRPNLALALEGHRGESPTAGEEPALVGLAGVVTRGMAIAAVRERDQVLALGLGLGQRRIAGGLRCRGFFELEIRIARNRVFDRLDRPQVGDKSLHILVRSRREVLVGHHRVHLLAGRTRALAHRVDDLLIRPTADAGLLVLGDVWRTPGPTDVGVLQAARVLLAEIGALVGQRRVASTTIHHDLGQVAAARKLVRARGRTLIGLFGLFQGLLGVGGLLDRGLLGLLGLLDLLGSFICVGRAPASGSAEA